MICDSYYAYNFDAESSVVSLRSAAMVRLLCFAAEFPLKWPLFTGIFYGKSGHFNRNSL